MEIQRFAQKGIVVNNKNEILLIRYANSKFLSEKLNGKYALPGGKIEFGETPDESIVNEIRQETGVTCKPGMPIHIWNWEYKKENDSIQINAITRICKYESGEPNSKPSEEKELTIDGTYWIPLEKLLEIDIVVDEKPSIDLLLLNFSLYKKLL